MKKTKITKELLFELGSQGSAGRFFITIDSVEYTIMLMYEGMWALKDTYWEFSVYELKYMEEVYFYARMWASKKTPISDKSLRSVDFTSSQEGYWVFDETLYNHPRWQVVLHTYETGYFKLYINEMSVIEGDRRYEQLYTCSVKCIEEVAAFFERIVSTRLTRKVKARH